MGIVIGTDGSRVYTVEGNSGDACKIKSYDLNYQSIKGYGLMNWVTEIFLEGVIDDGKEQN